MLLFTYYKTCIISHYIAYQLLSGKLFRLLTFKYKYKFVYLFIQYNKLSTYINTCILGNNNISDKYYNTLIYFLKIKLNYEKLIFQHNISYRNEKIHNKPKITGKNAC